MTFAARLFAHGLKSRASSAFSHSPLTTPVSLQRVSIVRSSTPRIRKYSTSLSLKAAPTATPSPSTKTSSPPPSRANGSVAPPSPPPKTLTDEPLKLKEEDPSHVDWTRSFHGLSVEPFSKEAADILLAPLVPEDVEIKPDGIIYLPEIKYRRILNRAFGPGGWGLAPRGETIVTEKAVTREYALLAHGR